MKKIASIFMAVAMVLALSVPAFASGSTITGSTVSGGTVEPDDPYSSEFVGEYQQTFIDIELPNNVALVFNPYRLEYSAAGHTTESGDDVVLVDKLADQIFSAPVTIVSKSNIQLDVDMSFTVTTGEGSEIVFAPSAAEYDAITDPGQNVLLQMEYGIVAAANADPSTSSDMKTITLSGEATLTDLQALEDEKDASDPTKVKNLTVTIPSGSPTNAKYFGYKFTGKASTDTSAAGDPPNPYNLQDTIGVGIAFTFLPKANEDIQVQGGTFTYNAIDNSDAAISTWATTVATKDVVVALPELKQLTAQESNFTVAGLKVNNVAVADDKVASTLTLDKDGKTLTLKAEAAWNQRNTEDVTVGTKYVKVIPVEFTAKKDANDAGITVLCNVRIVYDPQKAST